jgi:hypothetical protein
MKKLFLIGALVTSFGSSAFADFSVNGFTFNASFPTTLGAVFFDTVGGTPADATVKVDFLFGVTSGNLVASSPTTYTIQAGTGGFLNAGVINVTSASVGGGAGFYQMRAWTGGTSFTDAANTKIGTSAVTAITLGGTPIGGGTPLGVPDLSAHANFAIVTVPEPATLALGLFGAAGLLIRRRK